MVKILFCTQDRSDMVISRWLHCVEQETGKIAECKWAGKGHPLYVEGEDLNDTVKRVMPDADWVMWAGIHKNPPKNRDYKLALFLSDLHYSINLKARPAGMVKKMNSCNYDAFFMTYTKLAAQNHPFEPIDPEFYIKNLNAPIFHFAAAQDTPYYKPMKEKNLEAVFLGANHPIIYPIRYAVFEGLKPLAKKHGWRVMVRRTLPGRWNKSIKELYAQGLPAGPRYVSTLAGSKTFLFGSSAFKYPLPKFSEGMGSGTCCFSDTPYTAKELNFIPNWNFVEINAKNWKDKLTYYLSHDEEREEIAANGYKTFLKYHTTEVRARELVKFLEEN